MCHLSRETGRFSGRRPVGWMLPALVLGLIVGGSAGRAWAHRDPACNAVDVGLELRVTSDPGCATSIVGPVNEGQTIYYCAVLTKSDPASAALCAFELGDLIISTPAERVPVAGAFQCSDPSVPCPPPFPNPALPLCSTTQGPPCRIPCIGGTTNDPMNSNRGRCAPPPTGSGVRQFTSRSVPYTVNFAHADGTTLRARADYRFGIAHADADDQAPVTADATRNLQGPITCDCGEKLDLPCRITVKQPNGVVLSGFTSLQAAVNAAKDGVVPPVVGRTPQPAPPNAPTIINVTGACKGVTVVDNRKNLLIQGVSVEASRCPPMNGALASTLQGSSGDVLQVRDSEDIVVQYLNIVDGQDNEGLEFKQATDSAAYCNCVTRNDDGYELEGGGEHFVLDSLLFGNENGIRLHMGTVDNIVTGNLIKENRKYGILLLDSPTERNTVGLNTVKKNGLDCILLNEADVNDVLSNILGGGASNPLIDCGGLDIRVENDADDNFIDDNTDPDGTLVEVDCSNDGSDGNTGNNCQ